MSQKEPKGIGGWLLVPTIAFLLFAAYYLFVFIIIIPENFSMLVELLRENSTYLFIFILFRTLLFGLTGVLCIYTLILEFKKKESFPKWASRTLHANLILFAISAPLKSTIIVLLLTILGDAYLSKSQRIKNTFVE